MTNLAIICDVEIATAHNQSSAAKYFALFFSPSIEPLLRNIGGITCTLVGVTCTLDENISAICSLLVDHKRP